MIFKRIVDIYRDLRYELRCRVKPWNRLHVKSLPIYYKDPDALYLHSCFQILMNFVEDLAALSDDTSSLSPAEKGLVVLRNADDPDQTAMADLYEWWILRNTPQDRSYLINNGARNDMEITDKGVMHLNFSPEQEVRSIIQSTVDKLRFEEDERQLQRLTKLRSKMWV